MIEKFIQTTYECSEYTTFTKLGWGIFLGIGIVITMLVFIYLNQRPHQDP